MTGVRIGCAGWSIPKEHAEQFPDAGSHLERYARRFDGVEINSSFYRPHRPTTYARWAASTPEAFQFAVKAPREITHVRRLVDATEPLERFLREISALGPKLGPLLVQLPPSLAFERETAATFFTRLRERFAQSVACEPRHASWFTTAADQLLVAMEVARVAADPEVVPHASKPGGWEGLIYYRLHGSPRMYYSGYSAEYRAALSSALIRAAQAAPLWCIFDNTAEGAATADALDVMRRIQEERS